MLRINSLNYEKKVVESRVWCEKSRKVGEGYGSDRQGSSLSLAKLSFLLFSSHITSEKWKSIA